MLPWKWENLSRYLQKNTASIWLRAEQIFSVNIWYTYFPVLGVAFAVPFLCYFQKLQLLVVKKFSLIFAALYFYIYVLKKVSQIFKILFQTGDINIFYLRGVFLVDMFN